MADTKTSALGTITGANTATGDKFPILDVSDTTQGAGGTLKAITRAEMVAALDAAGMTVNSDLGTAAAQDVGYFATAAQGSTADSAMQDVVDDTTPQLGGSLDVNGNKIVSVTSGNIDIEPHGTGNVLLGNFTFDADQTVGAGQDNYVLTYDHAGGVIALEAAAGGGGTPGGSDTQIQVNNAGSFAGANIYAGTNVFDVRNSTSGQTLNLYNTWTDADNHERGFMRWNANVLEIGAEKAGTGTNRSLAVNVGGHGYAPYRFSTSANNLSELTFYRPSTGGVGGGFQASNGYFRVHGGTTNSPMGGDATIHLQSNKIYLEPYFPAPASATHYVFLGHNLTAVGLTRVLKADENTSRSRAGTTLRLEGGNAYDSAATDRNGGNVVVSGGSAANAGTKGTVTLDGSGRAAFVADATDLASAITLVNALKAALISHGLMAAS